MMVVFGPIFVDDKLKYIKISRKKYKKIIFLLLPAFCFPWVVKNAVRNMECVSEGNVTFL